MNDGEMLAQTDGRSEVLAAELAPVRMNSAVHSHVNVSIPRLIESLATYVTWIRQLTCYIQSSTFNNHNLPSNDADRCEGAGECEDTRADETICRT